jgi:PTS system nitrogen regulatory IIA component
MGNETMDLDQLATYLQRDVREVSKLANRGHLPGRRVGGEWRFARAEINHWLETQLSSYSEQQLTALERSHHAHPTEQPLLSTILTEANVAVPFEAKTRASVLRELVQLAEQTWNVFDPDTILEAVRQREETASTALIGGVALPHPHRPLPQALGDHVMAMGITPSPLPFSGPGASLTDIFILICCRDEKTHMRVLARWSRLLLRPGFLDELRASATPKAAWQCVDQAEADLLLAAE